MVSRRSVLAALALACLAPTGMAHAQGNCMRANSARERVTGTVIQRGSELFMRVDGPVCLRGSDAEDNRNNVAEIQLYTNSDALRRQLRRNVGQYIEVVGRPFGAITQHHRAPIVFEVRDVIRI